MALGMGSFLTRGWTWNSGQLIEAVKQQQREIRNLKPELRATRQTLEKVKDQVDATEPELVAVK